MIIDIAQSSLHELNVLKEIITNAEQQIRSLDLFEYKEIAHRHSIIVGWLCQVNNAIDIVTSREKVLNG